jgi:hypothetical protein
LPRGNRAPFAAVGVARRTSLETVPGAAVRTGRRRPRLRRGRRRCGCGVHRSRVRGEFAIAHCRGYVCAAHAGDGCGAHSIRLAHKDFAYRRARVVRGSGWGELRAVPPTCGRWTRILLQDTGVTSTHRPDMGHPRGNLAHTDAGTSIGIRRDDNEVLLACTGGFCSAIVRFAWSRHIRARRARAAGPAAR